MSSISRKLNTTIAGLWNKQGKPTPTHSMGSPSEPSGPGFGETQTENIIQTVMVKVDSSHSPNTKHPLCRLAPTGPKSASTNSINSESSTDSPLVEQEDIIELTQNVRSFSEVLARMKRIFSKEGDDKLENARVAAHECLGDILRILKIVLEKYSAIHSPEVLQAASNLITNVKGYKYDDEKLDPTALCESVDQLALAFSSRVSEYLMGDIDSGTIISTAKTRSCDNLSSIALSPDSNSHENSIIKLAPEILTPEEIDSMLMRLEAGVDLALYRAKVWSKYAKDVISYVEKRAILEAEHAKNLHKLAQTMRPLLKEESFLPFQSIYFTALDQDVEYALTSQSTCTVLQENKFIEPLVARRNEHEKIRKQIKDMWHRELKRMQDAINNLRKSRQLYIQRQQDHEKAKESVLRAETDSSQKESGTQTSNKFDKKKKLEEDAFIKASEAENTYKVCVLDANERQQELEKVKGEILTKVRELMYQCDQTMKAVTVGYFQLQHTVSAPAPVQFQTLCESSRLYEPGTQYMEYVKRLSASSAPLTSGIEPYVFYPYSPDFNRSADQGYRKNSMPSLGSGDGFDVSHYKMSADGRDKISKIAWSQNHSLLTGSDDTDSISSNSNRSHDTSPSASPQEVPRKHVIASSGDELDNDNDTVIYASGTLRPFRSVAMSKAAVTHKFRKLKTPSKCRECDTYLYFQGAECEECGLACHKKCLETLAIQCGRKRLPRKMTTFGVDFSQHLQETGSGIPPLITKCISELESRGLTIKGLYRVSGVKSKVEKLCQSFENGPELVDVTDIHPNVIANVLKLYLRQLPEPLLTFQLYPEFIRISKEYPNVPPTPNNHDFSNDPEESITKCIQDMKNIVCKLPMSNYKTTEVIMLHLKRLSEHEDENHMSCSNLGIVFGPTLLRSSDAEASLTLLMDTIHQTRAVEMLITYSEGIFGSSESNRKSEGETSEVTKTNFELGDKKRPLTDTQLEEFVLLRRKNVVTSPPSSENLTIQSMRRSSVDRGINKENEILQMLDTDKENTSENFSMILPGFLESLKNQEEERKSVSSEDNNLSIDDSIMTSLISDDEVDDNILPEELRHSESIFIQHHLKKGSNTTVINTDQLWHKTSTDLNTEATDIAKEPGITVIINTQEGTATTSRSRPPGTGVKYKPPAHKRSFSSDFSKISLEKQTILPCERSVPFRKGSDFSVSVKQEVPGTQHKSELSKRPTSSTNYSYFNNPISLETPEAPIRRRSGSLDNKHKRSTNITDTTSSSTLPNETSTTSVQVAVPISTLFTEEKSTSSPIPTGASCKHLPVIKSSLLLDNKFQALPSRPSLTLNTSKTVTKTLPSKAGHSRSESLGNALIEPTDYSEKSLVKDSKNSNLSDTNLSKLSSNRQPRFV